jgi:predicted deacylase
MHYSTIQQTTFHSLNHGQHMVVLGAVHGNEPCGAAAIRMVIDHFTTGKWQLTRGKVTFVPICNPLAYIQGTRFVERNLNRHFYPKPLRVEYEDAIDPILCALLDEADILLDIHSYQSQGGPFCFLGTTSQAEIDYCRALHVPLYVYGWADAFSSEGATREQRLAGLGTTDFVRANRKRGIATTLECGHHDNPANVDVAIMAIARALHHAGMLEMQDALPPLPSISPRAIKMHSVFYKEKAGQMVRPWQHGDAVKNDEVIARYEDGTTVTAPQEGVIILPKTQTDFALGAEWFYFGVETAFPDYSSASV